LYHIHTDNSTIHELIREDPGVEWVEQNWAVNKHLHRDVRKNNLEYLFNPNSSLSKRYYEYDNPFFWSVPQINSWGQRRDVRDAPPDKLWFDAKLLRTEGLGVNVYVVDDGVDISHVRLNNCGDEIQFDPPGGCARNFHKYYGPPRQDPYGDPTGHGTAVANCVIHTAIWSTIVNVNVYDAYMDKITQG
jgi:hypothetical protein